MLLLLALMRPEDAARPGKHTKWQPPVRQTGPPPRQRPRRFRHRADALERWQVLPRQPDRIAALTAF
jgi:hypothetical protein